MKVKLSLRENRIINIFKNKIEEKFPEEKIMMLVLSEDYINYLRALPTQFIQNVDHDAIAIWI